MNSMMKKTLKVALPTRVVPQPRLIHVSRGRHLWPACPNLDLEKATNLRASF